MFKQLVLFISVCALLCIAQCHACSLGEYVSGNACYKCKLGYYCPDGINPIQCAEGSVAGSYGMSKCDICPNGRTNTGRSVCLGKDIPQNIQEIDESTSFSVTPAGGYYFTTVLPREKGVKTTNTIEFSFLSKVRAMNGGLGNDPYGVRVSAFTSLNPKIINAQGVNATVVLSQDVGGDFQFSFIVVFKISPIAVQTILSINLRSYFTNLFEINMNGTIFDATKEGLDLQPYGLGSIVFVKDGIKRGTTVNVFVESRNCGRLNYYYAIYGTSSQLVANHFNAEQISQPKQYPPYNHT